MPLTINRSTIDDRQVLILEWIEQAHRTAAFGHLAVKRGVLPMPPGRSSYGSTGNCLQFFRLRLRPYYMAIYGLEISYVIVTVGRS